MFYTIFTFRAKQGQEAAIVALFAVWQLKILSQLSGFVASDVLRDTTDRSAFMSVVTFMAVEAARAISDHPEQAAWYQQLLQLVEGEPTIREFTGAA